jgi:hypothetical protein
VINATRFEACLIRSQHHMRSSQSQPSQLDRVQTAYVATRKFEFTETSFGQHGKITKFVKKCISWSRDCEGSGKCMRSAANFSNYPVAVLRLRNYNIIATVQTETVVFKTYVSWGCVSFVKRICNCCSLLMG